MFVIEFSEPTLSLNKLQRLHWAARKRVRDSYEQWFRWHARPEHRAKRSQFRHVTIERHGSKQLDHDNFVGGCKPLVDALIRARLIWDDSPDFLTVDYIQCKAKRSKTKTVVKVI